MMRRGRHRAMSKPLQHLDLVPFDIDRQEIERSRAACLFENAVEGADGHADDFFRGRTWCHAAPVERRQRSGDVQRQLLPGVRRRRAGGGEHLGLAFGAQRRREIRLRLDEHAAPALLLQMPGLRALTRIVGAHLDVITFDISEEGGHQPRFLVGRKARQGRNFQPERDFGARVRSTIELVEWPGTRSIRMISPPSASTISRPTTCSRV